MMYVCMFVGLCENIRVYNLCVYGLMDGTVKCMYVYMGVRL